jgi:hypothetical protein
VGYIATGEDPEYKYRVTRKCSSGQCPCSDGECDCSEPTVDVGVDELTPAELDYFWASGTDDQRLLIQLWLAGDEQAELLAGRPDVPSAFCGACDLSLDCIVHSRLHHEGW